jgi:hypothetical protein
MLRATLPCQREILSLTAWARIDTHMNTAVMIESVPRSDVCPYCGQPVTRQQLNDIRARVRAEEQARLKVLERQLREQAAAAAKAEAAKLTKQAAELAAREKALAIKQKQVEATAKARYDDGYRKARGEAARIQLQLQKQVDDLKRRLERKTADDLGAISEEDLLDCLRRRYPDDAIERVPRGAAGADILHEVHWNGGVCGRIVYESKNVKTFLSAFVEKATGYRTQYDTPYVVLVTTAFPAGERDFCARDGVLLVHPSKVTYVIDIIRGSLIEVARAGAAGAARDTKGERLLAYVTSDEFKERLRGVLDAVDDLRNLQAEERKRHEGIWCAQEEAFRGIQKFAGRVQSQVRAIVEGRETGGWVAVPREAP